MTILQMLTLRRNAALARLATLEKRAERLGSPSAAVITSALSELSTALEEIKVAADQLQLGADELSAARRELQQLRREFTEFLDILPMPCVWTTGSGEIDVANSAAAELLNVSGTRLAGRPLMLFLNDRQAFAEALRALNDGLTKVIEVPAVVRPRERRPRSLRLVGRSLSHDTRHCWFLMLTPERPVPRDAADAETARAAG